MHIQVVRGQSWNSLPEDLRRRICIEALEQGIDDAWLPILEEMHTQEPADFRLATVCVRGLCDKREFERAYAVCRRSLIACATKTFASDPKKTIEGIWQYFTEMRLLVSLKQHVDIMHRRDALPRHPSAGELERTFEMARDNCKAMLPALSVKEQGWLLFALLELAMCSDSEDHVLDVTKMFIQSAAKDDLATYGDFMRQLQASPHPRQNDRAKYLAEFGEHIEATMPNKKAFFRVLREQTGYRLEQWIDGVEEEAVKIVLQAVVFAVKTSSRIGLQVVRGIAGQLLDLLDDSKLKLKVAATLAQLKDQHLRTIAAKHLRDYGSQELIDPEDFDTVAEALLHLNEVNALRALHAHGMFDGPATICPKHLNWLYATMGLFREGVEKMRQARHDNIAHFAATGDADHFIAANIYLDEIPEFEFLQKCNDILNSVPQPKEPRGLFVVVSKGPHELNQYPILAMVELKRRGYAIIPLAAGTIDYEPTGIPEIDELANQFDVALAHVRCEFNMLPEPHHPSRFPFLKKLFERDVGNKRKWVWDPDNFELSYGGVNAYWGIREDICCTERRYTVDFSLPRYQPELLEIRRRIETWEIVLSKIAAVGRTRGIPIRIIMQYVHLTTNYYCRKYAEAASAKQDISVIHSAIAYENYFMNFVKDESTTLAVQDMTKLRDLAASSYAPGEWFLRHYEELPQSERDRIVEAVERVIKQDRIRKGGSATALERLRSLKTEREKGHRIVALFGKVLFDQGLPRGDGVVHKDMRDWFDHSVNIVRRNPNVHLVIKPHPHELRDEIALYASEVLKDWLPSPIPKNVHFLGNDEINLHELAEILDLALVWNGMSGLELGVLGVPTTLGAYYGTINFPVGHVKPKSREDFERIVLHYSKQQMSDEVRRMSAVLIDYHRHPEVSVPYRYTYRGLTNKHIYLRWFEEDLAAYESGGDPNVKVLADRLEGISYAERPR